MIKLLLICAVVVTATGQFNEVRRGGPGRGPGRERHAQSQTSEQKATGYSAAEGAARYAHNNGYASADRGTNDREPDDYSYGKGSYDGRGYGGGRRSQGAAYARPGPDPEDAPPQPTGGPGYGNGGAQVARGRSAGAGTRTVYGDMVGYSAPLPHPPGVSYSYGDAGGRPLSPALAGYAGPAVNYGGFMGGGYGAQVVNYVPPSGPAHAQVSPRFVSRPGYLGGPGPVPAQIHGHGHGYQSYAAPNYKYAYQVKGYGGPNFGHTETRHGKDTRGQYHVGLPDGRTQQVKYNANGYGYFAEVTYH